ncbi:MAG: DUF2652 domain-containing protein [Anaerolineae bacterium]|nr:DUF2652 domain-containing protein [Anaerolineae bacterium]
MTENATIFIPDISGYTDFMSKTELEHGSHIINELLELLVESNRTDCTLSEVEGDALLFYHKGEPIAMAEMTRQCLDMFQNFHARLKLIERDSLCQCGACQTASRLTLKFIIHYGAIKEIKVANFIKASGLDMIIAHRLLKNRIDSDEYILATQGYWDHLSDKTPVSDLAWQPSFEEYPAVGKLNFQFTLLEKIKSQIPAPPPREKMAFTVGNDSMAIDIALSMMEVYQFLIDLGNRVHWVSGLKRGEGEKTIDRLGAKHLCIFDELTVEIIPQQSEFLDNEIRYVEASTVVENGMKSLYVYRLTPQNDKSTRLTVTIGAEAGHELAPEVLAMMLSELQIPCENFKAYCEAHAN